MLCSHEFWIRKYIQLWDTIEKITIVFILWPNAGMEGNAFTWFSRKDYLIIYDDDREKILNFFFCISLFHDHVDYRFGNDVSFIRRRRINLWRVSTLNNIRLTLKYLQFYRLLKRRFDANNACVRLRSQNWQNIFWREKKIVLSTRKSSDSTINDFWILVKAFALKSVRIEQSFTDSFTTVL